MCSRSAGMIYCLRAKLCCALTQFMHACCCRGLASNMGVQNFSSAQQWRGIAMEALERRRWALHMLVPLFEQWRAGRPAACVLVALQAEDFSLLGSLHACATLDAKGCSFLGRLCPCLLKPSFAGQWHVVFGCMQIPAGLWPALCITVGGQALEFCSRLCAVLSWLRHSMSPDAGSI